MLGAGMKGEQGEQQETRYEHVRATLFLKKNAESKSNIYRAMRSRERERERAEGGCVFRMTSQSLLTLLSSINELGVNDASLPSLLISREKEAIMHRWMADDFRWSLRKIPIREPTSSLHPQMENGNRWKSLTHSIDPVDKVSDRVNTNRKTCSEQIFSISGMSHWYLPQIDNDLSPLHYSSEHNEERKHPYFDWSRERAKNDTLTLNTAPCVETKKYFELAISIRLSVLRREKERKTKGKRSHYRRENRILPLSSGPSRVSLLVSHIWPRLPEESSKTLARHLSFQSRLVLDPFLLYRFKQVSETFSTGDTYVVIVKVILKLYWGATGKRTTGGEIRICFQRIFFHKGRRFLPFTDSMDYPGEE